MLFCHVLYYPSLPYTIIKYPILFCPFLISPCPILYYPLLPVLCYPITLCVCSSLHSIPTKCFEAVKHKRTDVVRKFLQKQHF